MTYGEIAELALRNDAGGDISQDFSVKMEEAVARISAMLPFLIRKDFYETYSLEGGAFDGGLYTTFTASLNKPSGDSAYIVLPSAPFIIHGRGIPELFYTSDIETQFTFVDIGQYRMYKKIGVTEENTGIIYFYEFDQCAGEHRLVFIDDVTDIEKLKIRMVQGIPDGGENSTVPGHLVEPVLQGLRAWYSPQANMQADLVNDGRNNPPGGMMAQKAGR